MYHLFFYFVDITDINTIITCFCCDTLWNNEKKKNEYSKNQCIQYEYNPRIEEKIEYFHDTQIKILLNLFSLNYRCISNDLIIKQFHLSFFKLKGWLVGFLWDIIPFSLFNAKSCSYK